MGRGISVAIYIEKEKRMKRREFLKTTLAIPLAPYLLNTEEAIIAKPIPTQFIEPVVGELFFDNNTSTLFIYSGCNQKWIVVKTIDAEGKKCENCTSEAK